MRSLAFLVAGLALLVVQSNVFRAVDDVRPAMAGLAWVIAVIIDVVRGTRPTRTIATFRADWSLPATVLFAYALLTGVAHAHVARPLPALVLPLILFMGVHEYSLARGAAVSFALGHATDILGIAPVGLYTFTYVATFVLARAAGVRLATQTTWMQVLLAGAFALLQSTMILVLLAIFGHDAWVPRSLYPLAFSHAIATAAVAPLLFRLSQWIDLATSGSARAETAGGALS
jgi:rod shape-determining protein MreD